MGTVEATPKKGEVRRRKRPAPEVTEAQLRDLLDRALAEVDADAKAGSQLRATGLRARLRISDLGLVLDVEPSEEGDHHLRWTFSGSAEREPKLELTMDSQVANAYLQGQGEPGDRDGTEQGAPEGDGAARTAVRARDGGRGCRVRRSRAPAIDPGLVV